MASLSDYEVTLYRLPWLGTWSWRAKTPGGHTLECLFGLFQTQEAAEADALRKVELHLARYTIAGDELRRRVVNRPTS